MKNKKTSEEKRQRRKQLTMTISMIIVSVLVISVASYAWYKLTNTPKIVSAEFTADTIGNLQISNVKVVDGADTPKGYTDAIGLFDGVDPAEKAKMYLSPVTTEDGLTFFKPVYLEGKVDHLEPLDESIEAQYKELHTKYIYEKKFFLRAGSDNVDQDKAKYYDIHFIGMSQDEINKTVEFEESTGTFIIKKDEGDETAAYSIRISFEFENAEPNAETNNVVIYEPNSEKHITTNGDSSVIYTNKDGENYGKYKTLKQLSTKSFLNDDYNGTEAQSGSICTIKEGEDVECTLRMWIEGMDEDCVNQIAADTMKGQIQFISTENLTYITNGN